VVDWRVGPEIKGLAASLGLTAVALAGLIRGLPFGGQVAQLVEQRTENPRVGGSIPPLATIQSKLFGRARRESYVQASRP
jgi:F0F1-type ATP synthase membrane subunit c/vacuolar-type H+-ATPase subunit K